MKIGELSFQEVRERLRSREGLPIELGPYAINVRSKHRNLAEWVSSLMPDYPLSDDPIADFHVVVDAPNPVRRLVRRQSQFSVDGYAPFEPLPEGLSLPSLEWGVNWCIATRSNHRLMLHAAAVAHGDRALLLPAWPGHGKSTLCAAMMFSGWRLLSDEFGIVDLENFRILPLPRLLPLKNESIDVIGAFAPEARFGPRFHGTRKGTIAHLVPPADSIEQAQRRAEARWLIFPKWESGAALTLTPMSPAHAFLMVATNAFNYEVVGAAGFRAVQQLIQSCDCYSLTYSHLDEAVSALNQLAQSDR